jgi:hypothetical protein
VELEREATSFLLLCRHDAAHGVARDAFRQRECDRGTPGEDLGETKVAVAESTVHGQLVVDGDHAQSMAARHERRVQPGSCAERAGLGLVDVGIVEKRVDA